MAKWRNKRWQIFFNGLTETKQITNYQNVKSVFLSPHWRKKKIPLKRQMLARQSLTHLTFTGISQTRCVHMCVLHDCQTWGKAFVVVTLIYFSVRFEINFMTSVPHTSIALCQWQWLYVCVCAAYLNASKPFSHPSTALQNAIFSIKNLVFTIKQGNGIRLGAKRSLHASLQLQIPFDACLVFDTYSRLSSLHLFMHSNDARSLSVVFPSSQFYYF